MEHPGNKLLRSIVRAQKQRFIQVKKDEKRSIAFNIVDDILRLGGRFLTKDHTKHASNMAPALREEIWVCVDREKAADKVMRRLREKDHCVENVDRVQILQSAAAHLLNVEDDESRTRTAKKARKDEICSFYCT